MPTSGQTEVQSAVQYQSAVVWARQTSVNFSSYLRQQSNYGHQHRAGRAPHSDRGVQYCCHAYVKMLRRNKIKISMTQSGDPLENAVAERVNRTIKEEFTNDRQLNFINIVEAKSEIKKFINFYNTKRPHRSLQWLTPNAAHERVGFLKRMWKTY